MSCVIAIDAGTTGIRSIAFFTNGDAPIIAYREITQHFPRPGWVEHDPLEIWNAAKATLVEVFGQVRGQVSAIGITNQRETAMVWNSETSKPYGRAIVWQDRRTADRCQELANHLTQIRNKTGLVLDPYFSATKIEWLLKNGDFPRDEHLRIGTVDTWLIWNLTKGKSFLTDPTNASRTMLFDIHQMRWDEELCELFGVSQHFLPAIQPSSSRFGYTSGDSIPEGIPISGVAGDQQAALFGQACFQRGSTKITYGTGSFVLMNVGTTCPPPQDGLLTTVAWQLGGMKPVYALEGAIFSTGSAIQWLRDGLQIINKSSEIGALAKSAEDSGGVVFVPAFTGLGSPWWEPNSRGSIFGITSGTSRAHIARATIESIVFQVRDVIELMSQTSGLPIVDLRVDGGVSALDMMLQLQADNLGSDVVRPIQTESTAIGAAYLAGLTEGLWNSEEEIMNNWKVDRRFPPKNQKPDLTTWRAAVQRTMKWSS